MIGESTSDKRSSDTRDTKASPKESEVRRSLLQTGDLDEDDDTGRKYATRSESRKRTA